MWGAGGAVQGLLQNIKGRRRRGREVRVFKGCRLCLSGSLLRRAPNAAFHYTSAVSLSLPLALPSVSTEAAVGWAGKEVGCFPHCAMGSP